jgi:hypothetical protein
MMKRTVLTFLAAAAISAPVVIAPALVTPAAAQVDLSVNLGIPAPVPFFGAPAVQPVYYGWGREHYRWWEHRQWEHRQWERDHWRHEHWYR